MNALSNRDPQGLQAELATLREAQARLFADLASNAQRYRSLARSVLRLQEEERRRFARDLHDGLGQQITAVLHQLEPLARDESLPTEAAARARRALDLCSRALHDARNLARLMRPTILDDLGLVAALHWLSRTVAETAGIDIDVECEDEAGACGTEMSTLVFRFVQEALNNVAKHAKAQRALVAVNVRAGQLTIVVADDGRGFDANAAPRGGGSGLSGLAERVALFGGRFTCASNPGDGTQLRAFIPLDSERRDA